MVVYLAPLFFLFLALIAQIRKSKQADMAALAICTFFCILIAGTRWYSDIDYDGYVIYYKNTPVLKEFNRESIATLYGEAGYLFVSAVFKTLGSGFSLLAFACALSSLSLKSAVVRKLSGQASLAMGLYLSFNFITTEFIQIRWAVATGLLSLGFCYQYLQKYKAAVLCFTLSLAFHYFSVVFWIVALLVTLKGYKRFFLLLLVSLLGALFLKLDYFRALLISDSDVYVLTKLTTYASESNIQVSLFSFAKLIMYPAIYAFCAWCQPSYPWRTDRLNLFLSKLSLVAISLTLLVSFLPMLHWRARVIADLFSIMWVLNALDKALGKNARVVAFGALCALFTTWYLVDLWKDIHNDRLFEYHSWLTIPMYLILLAFLACLACRKLWNTILATEVAARA